MWREAIHLLTAQHPLLVVESDRQVRLQGTNGCYILTLQPLQGDATTTEYNQPQLALLAFLDQIGEMALVRAVGVARYSFLFPTGSSLDWPQKPLSTWRPPARWRRRVRTTHCDGYRAPMTAPAAAIAASM
ncbi:MAG: hypothetical protein AAFV53_06685 [Myxococcota bacterium]